MAPLNLMDFDNSILHVLCFAVALAHPPHWEFPDSYHPHGWEPRTYIEHIDKDRYYQKRRPTYCLGWIQLSHVNRRLRQICLNSPSLWSNIVISLPSGNPSVMSALLSRTGQAPLSLSIPAHDWRIFGLQNRLEKEHCDKAAFAAKHLDRAVTLKTYFPYSPYDPGWYPIFQTQQLPLMQHLELYQPPNSTQIYIPINAPNLLELRIGGGAFPLADRPMSMLRRLELNLNIHVSRNMTLKSVAPILNFLRGTPLLEELKLLFVYIDPVKGFIDEEVVSGDKIPLMRLRKAQFIETREWDEPSCMWSQIEAPDAVRLRFDLFPNSHKGNPAVVLRSAMKQLNFGDYNSIRLDESEDKLVVYVSQVHGIPPGIGRDDGVCFTWCLPSKNFVQTVLTALVPLVVHANITALRLEGFMIGEGTTLPDFLRAFPAVTLLAFELAEKSFDAPEPEVYIHPLDNITNSMLPALNTLAVGYPSDMSRNFTLFTEHWNSVTWLLERRVKARRPIGAVTLFGGWPVGKKAREVDEMGLTLMKRFAREFVDGRS